MEYDVYAVPTDQGTRDLALVKKGLTESTFIDPANPQAGQIKWQGSWRSLDRSAWTFAPHWENFARVWDLIDYPRLLFNTLAIAVISTIGTLLFLRVIGPV